MILTNRIYFLLAILIVLQSSCDVKERKLDCSAIKTGRFEFHGGYSDRLYTIERNDSIQIEKDLRTHLGVKLAIKWTGPCEYELSLISFTVNGKDSIADHPDFNSMKTRITKISKNYYVCESVDNKGGGSVDTMLIVK